MEDQKLSPERRMRETGRRLKPFCKFATAVPLFLLLLQKKKWQKENEPEGISISPQTPLNRPRKPLRFSWIFPAKTGRYEPRISSPRIPSCLSLWDMCLSEAKTERVDAALKPSQSPAATAPLTGEPKNPLPLLLGNNNNRRQWRMKGVVVGAAANKAQVQYFARSECWEPQPGQVALRSNDGEV